MSGNSKQKKVLILGAGFVASPLVEYLYRNKNITINICSSLEVELSRMLNRYPRITTTCVDVLQHTDILTKLCQDNDIVVSLLPNNLQYLVTEQCILTKRNLVTASYARHASNASDNFDQLDKTAQEAGITILNEIGLDPGIDHLLTLELVDSLKARQGKIESLTSFCGGLPVPENADNVLRYKFSWSPRGTLLNTVTSAEYLWNGHLIKIPSGGEVISTPIEIPYLPKFDLEGFPNRDSTNYAKLYKIDDTVHSLLRGTLRYKGFSSNMKILQQLGLLDTEPHSMLQPNGPNVTWIKLISSMLGLKQSSNEVNDTELLYRRVVDKLDNKVSLDCLQNLGLLEDVTILKMTTPLDTLSAYLTKRLSFGDDERDLIIMRLECVVRWPDNTLEKHFVEFVATGETAASGGHLAMAKTVGYPVAIATEIILNNEISETGLILPFSPSIYQPILSKLSDEGLTAIKTKQKITLTEIHRQ